jgi:hypothetical protein
MTIVINLVINLLSAATAYVISTLLSSLLYALTFGGFPYSDCLFCTLVWWVLIPLNFWFFITPLLLVYLAAAWTSPGDDSARFDSRRMAISGFILGVTVGGVFVLSSHGSRVASPPSLLNDGRLVLLTSTSGAIGCWLSAHMNNGLISLYRCTRAVLERRSATTP